MAQYDDEFEIPDSESRLTPTTRTVFYYGKEFLLDVGFIGPIVAILGMFLAFQITIAPYRHYNHPGANIHVNPTHQLGALRPHLSQREITYIHAVTMNAETEFTMPPPSKDIVKLRFHSSATEHGTHSPPQMFYQGVIFGLSHENPFGLDYTAQSSRKKEDLFFDLQTMNPRPTYVIHRSAEYNITVWRESGYAIYFSYVDLAKQGKLSSDRRQPWKRVLDDVLKIARDYNQVYITVWYPHTFGKKAVTDGEVRTSGDQQSIGIIELHPFEVVLQEIIPTRTGLEGVKSTSAVWMSAVNKTSPHKFNPMGIHKAYSGT